MSESVHQWARASSEANERLTTAEESVARKLVSAQRLRLEWLLRVPELEELLPEGVNDLGLAGRRQGIGFRAAVLALPLESKYELVRWALDRLRKHLPRATAQSMCRVMSVERFSELDLDEVLTARQWNSLRSRVSFRLSREHKRYKHAQQLLYTGFRHLVDKAVAKSVYDAKYRADCLQEGSMGLLQAIDRADDGDQDFGAYASTWIKRSVKNYLMRQRLPVHAPVNLISKASIAGSIREADGQEKSEPVNSRLCALLMECLRRPSVSLDEAAPVTGTSLREELWDPLVASPAEETDRSDLAGLLDHLLESLTDKQRFVVEARFGLIDGVPQTLTQIARTTGISHQQVSMREKRALERLQDLVRPVLAELQA